MENSQNLNTVLLIEDDDDYVEVIEYHLNDLGFQLDRAADGEAGLQLALEKNYALILLDIMLPKMNGTEVCRKIRRAKRDVPIVMLTAKGEDVDKILGLELGADDYITKPFNILELMARIKAILRRTFVQEESASSSAKDKMIFDEMEIDLVKRRVTINNQELDLRPQEFELLVFLAAHPGRPFTRDELLHGAWGLEYSGYSHTVSSHINRLRRKIEEHSKHGNYVETMWGVGYKFREFDRES